MNITIIGAGPSGIVSAKSALEVGLVPRVLEKESDIGGLWNPYSGGTWESMSTNLSRFTCMFSDFPWKENSKDFPTKLEMYEYLNQYIEHFKLRKYIHLLSEVTNLNRNEAENKWNVQWKINGSNKSEMCDFVIISSGFFSTNTCFQSKPETFIGNLIYSKDYKNSEPFRNKQVTVVGGSFSGTEIACDIATVAAKVTHISPKAFWILPRYLPMSIDGNTIEIPVDLVFYKRKSEEFPKPTEQEMNTRKHKWFSALSKQQAISPALQIPEEQYIYPPYVAISDGYLEAINSGKIELKRGKATFLENDRLVLEDQTAIKTDAVVICSGYITCLPFLSKMQLDSLEFSSESQFQPLLLHKGMFNPELTNIAFIGMYRGPYFGVMELQSRWACMAFSNPNQYYPTPEEMKEGIEIERQIRFLSPRPQFPHGDYVNFADSIAKRIGVFPNRHLEGKDVDPELSQTVKEGCVIPSHYRLEGSYSNYNVSSEIIKEYKLFMLKYKV